MYVVSIGSVIFDTVWLIYSISDKQSTELDSDGITDQNLPTVCLYEIDASKVSYYLYGSGSGSESGSGSGSESDCAVCLEPYKIGDNIVKLHCGHLYHYNCVCPWLKTNGMCPTCRSKESVLST